MKPIEILQGKWLGHPLHPAVVHLSLALWLFACVFDIVVVLGGGGAVLPRLSFYCVLGGLIGALIAVPTGVADWAPIKQEKPAWKLGLYHMLLNLLAILIWGINFGLRIDTLGTPRPVTPAILLLSVMGSILLLVAGYLGSLMVFDQGTSVGRLSKTKWRQIALQGGARVPEKK